VANTDAAPDAVPDALRGGGALAGRAPALAAEDLPVPESPVATAAIRSASSAVTIMTLTEVRLARPFERREPPDVTSALPGRRPDELCTF